MNAGKRASTLTMAARLLGAAGLLLVAQPTLAAITGSAHDFTIQNTSQYQTGTPTPAFANNSCAACHTPHGGTTVGGAPAWARSANATNYTTYQSPTFMNNVAAPQPGAASLLCLSCHDGAAASIMNNYMNVPAAFNQATKGNILINPGNRSAGASGTDLSGSHPIGFAYDAAIQGNGTYVPTNTANYQIGTGGTTKSGTLAQVLLKGSSAATATMECTSCHDVHATFSDNSTRGLLLVGNWSGGSNGGNVCMACHKF